MQTPVTVPVHPQQQWIEVVPSEADPTLALPRPITRAETVYDFNSPHLVCMNREPTESLPTLTHLAVIHVFLAGTGSAPTFKHTAKHWLSRSAALGHPSIALSYQWANLTDQEKNQAIALASPESSDKQQLQLSHFHNDVVFGGSKSGLNDVHPSSSIDSRLHNLIIYLSSHGPCQALWKSLLLPVLGDPDCTHKPRLDYSRIVLSGHSQGAGHACYYAMHRPFRRAILLSGPQDLLSSTSSGADESIAATSASWLADPAVTYQTTDIRSFMHSDEEGTADLIRANWRFIEPLQSPDCSSQVVIKEISESRSSDHSDPRIPGNEILTSTRCFMTRVSPSAEQWRSLITADGDDALYRKMRPCHNSTVGDGFTPMIEIAGAERMPLYTYGIWTELFRGI